MQLEEEKIKYPLSVKITRTGVSPFLTRYILLNNILFLKLLNSTTALNCF
jgi:hypothetical protein